MEVACGSRHPFTSNHALISSFFHSRDGIVMWFLILGKNGDAMFESDILRMKYDVVTF